MRKGNAVVFIGNLLQRIVTVDVFLLGLDCETAVFPLSRSVTVVSFYRDSRLLCVCIFIVVNFAAVSPEILDYSCGSRVYAGGEGFLSAGTLKNISVGFGAAKEATRGKQIWKEGGDSKKKPDKRERGDR